MNEKIIIGLTNPKSPTNVGAVLRAAGCFGADEILYTGNRYDIAKKFATDTQLASEHVSLSRVEDFINEVEEDMELVCVDFVEGAIPLPKFKHPKKALYLFGPEDGSLKQEIVSKAKHVVYMPTNGSLNLAASVNVVLYDRLAKSENLNLSNELIKQSRDVNNQLKVGD